MRDKAKVAELLAALKTQMTTRYEISVVEDCEILLYEEWRDVKNYEGLYQVNNLGRARSFHNSYGRILKPIVTKDGYLQLNLSKDGKSKSFRLHILVAQVFIPNPKRVTSKKNIQHAYRTGLAKSGPDHKRSLLNAEQVRYIRRVYKKGDPEFGMSALGKKFGVSISVICGVICRKTYKNVD